MKHPYLCACLTFALGMTVYQPGVRLNAAELWNSTETGSSSSPYYVEDKSYKENKSGNYYNTPKNSNTVDSGVLFNVQDSAAFASRKGYGGLKSVVQAYKDVKKGKQRQSKQFAFMSASAVSNRQADIDFALQLEYKRRKATAKHMIEVYKEVEAARITSEKAHQEQRAAIEAEKQEKALERKRKKDRALGRKDSYRSSGRSSSSRSSSSRSSHGGYTTDYQPSSSSTRLKKPTRLFNDPNE